MRVRVAEHSGFCMGVRRAVERAMACEPGSASVLGELIHNRSVTGQLEARGICSVERPEDCRTKKLLIRSHGVGKEIYARAEAAGLEVVDATCVYVKKIHETVERYHALGYTIVIAGTEGHPEVEGIDGWCGHTAVIVGDEGAAEAVSGLEKVCVVSQTTFSPQKFEGIIKKLRNNGNKIVEIFNTICYTTEVRLREASELAAQSDLVIVLGGLHSSNTRKLYEVCTAACPNVRYIESAAEIDDTFRGFQNVAVVAGASTPSELIKEVKFKMEEMNNAEVQAEEIEKTEAVETAPVAETVEASVAPQPEKAEEAAESSEPVTEAVAEEPACETVTAPVEINTMADVMEAMKATDAQSGKRGQVVKATIVEAKDEGLMLQIGSRKTEILLPAGEITVDGTYDKNNEIYAPGNEIEVIVTNTNPMTVSEKKLLLNRIDDEKLVGMGEGSEFKITVENFNKGGLTARYASASVFIPASQIKLGFVKAEPEELKKFIGKEMKVRALKVEGRKIVASAKVILEEERAARQEKKNQQIQEFFDSIEIGQVVNGKVVRFTDFGAFVNVEGFDCLAHISDLAWTNVEKASDILTKDQNYDFVVLKIDNEKKHVSIGYKQLQPKPWQLAGDKYPVGTVITGKVVRLAPFGAFVAVEPGIDGLVHVSQITHDWIEKPESALHVGDEIEAKVIEINPEAEKMSLSIKALLPEPEETEDRPRRPRDDKKFERVTEKLGEKKERKPRREEGPREWTSSDNGGASIGEMLKGLNFDFSEEKEEAPAEDKTEV